MKHIPLSGRTANGRTTLVDDDTFEKYGHLTWHMTDTGYAARRNGNTTQRLHRLVAECPAGKVVDHLNNDRLDNRTSNLRVCTQAENSRNRRATKGYTWDKSRGKWKVAYRGAFYGRYESEDEAKKAYAAARSGVVYKKKRRSQYMLPRGIHKQFGKYNVSIQLKGKRLRKNGVASFREAVDTLNKLQKAG